MKNFTNNFKQFTSRLSARWLIMALMLLVGTSSAWGKTLYVYSSNSSSYAWIWNRSNSNNFTGGTWPGAKLNNTTYFTALGNNWYKFKTNITVEYGLILSGGASSGQTSDLFITDDIYCIKHNGGSSSETYGTPSGYKIKNSWGSDINFASFSEAKQAYTMNSIELAAGTYTMQVYKGSSKYWSSFDNSRGSGVTLSGGGEGGFSFTLASAMNVTFFYDPGADKAFAVGVSSTYTVEKSETGGTGTVTLGGTTITTGGVSISSGSKALSITAPAGYNVSTVTVSGGSLTTAGSTGSSSYSGTVNVTAATTITITYVAKTYTITYKDQGNVTFSGTHASGYPTTHTYGTATELKTATKAGYTFGGWFTTSACTGNAVTSLGATAYSANITLYAKWTEVCNPISDLTWTITSGAKATYCPGDQVTVTMTYNGSTAKGYKWGGDYKDKIGILGGSIASGAVYTMTINKPGSVNLTLTDCEGNEVTTTPTLEFTTHETPATPTITFSVNPVGQSKETILSIASYSADNNYIVYRSADNAVGNDTEVGTYTAPMSIRHNDTGSYYYYAKATNKSCANLTATSAIVPLTVQEAGAIIAALGDLKVDPQDPVDFVAMYVKNDGLSDYTDQGATEVTGYTWQFSSDEGNTWTDCASTNVVDGVNYELGMENGSVNCNNFRPNVAGKYRCVVKYDVGEQSSNILTVTSDGSTDKTFNGVTMTLPVVSVNTGDGNFPVNDFGGTPSKNASSDKMKAKISVDVKIFENINGTTQVVYDRKARMNYRGSSSMNFLKKSYAFCPGDEMCGDKKGVDYVKTAKLNMLGIGNALDKDWVLYAAAADPSLMRNRLMFDTFRDMTGGWSVNSRYVELVVNGEYRGVYVMMDKITKNDNRINVKWKIDKNTGETTQKGFIIKLDKTDIVDRYENNGDKKTFKSKYSGHDGFETYDTEIDQRFEIEYPEKEDIEDDGGDWSIVYNEILGMVNKFEEELAKGNFTEVQKLIDYESWADWFIITEYGKNIDGYRASNLFVFDENGKGKLEARPLWDQELSFNNQCPSYYGSYGSSSTSGLLIDKTNSAVYDNDASAPFWFTGKYKGGRGTYNGSDQTFKGLLDDPCFVAVLQSRWEKHVSGALSQKSLTDKENNYISELGNIGTNGTPMNRELKFWQNNKGRHYVDCGTGAEKSCYNGTTGYSSYNTSESITQSATDLTNWLTGDRRTNLGNIINNMEGTDLRISLTMTPANGETTPWEAVMVEVNNPSGYDYDLEYTTNTLDKVEGVIINENNDKYTYRIPRPSTWGTGDGERDAIEYGIQAILNVSDDNLQCGTINEEFTKADVTITLKDEEDDDCSIVEP